MENNINLIFVFICNIMLENIKIFSSKLFSKEDEIINITLLLEKKPCH